MEELDLLKKDWNKSRHSYNEVSENDIYSMLHKKSSSIVKWIFYISLLELAMGFVVSTCLSFTKYDSQSIEFIKKWGIYQPYLAFSVFMYLVVFYFIYKFYTMYRKISVVDNTKQLLTTIINTRKVVKYYVIFNLSCFAFLFVTILSFSSYHGYLDAMIKKGIENPEIPTKVIVLGILFILVFAVILTFLFWLFYRLLYGILLRRLHRNYNELKKIDL